MINNICATEVQKKLNLFLDAQTEKKKRTNRWCSILFLGGLCEKVARVLKKTGVRVTFKNNTCLRSHFVKVKDPIEL